MEAVYKFSEIEIVSFAMVLIRISCFIVVWPIFGVETVPNSIKVLLALVLTLAVFPVLPRAIGVNDFGSPLLITMVIKEVFIGITFGFVARAFFMATRVAGELISLSVGLSGAQLYNPSMGGQTTPMDQLIYMLAALLYLAIDGHHLLLTGLVDTFRLIPIGPQMVNLKSLQQIGAVLQEVISIGVRISAPVLISILMLNLVMGILGKTVPQINVLVTGLAVNLIVGLVVMIVALPHMMGEMPNLMENGFHRLFQLMRSF